MPVVAAAIMIRDGKVFIAKRPEGKSLAHHWEFPGGKQERGEELPKTLHRELSEELNIDAQIGDFFMKSVYEYEFGTIEMNCYFAKIAPNIEVVSNEHEDIAWVKCCDLHKYTFAPADIPIVQALEKMQF